MDNWNNLDSPNKPKDGHDNSGQKDWDSAMYDAPAFGEHADSLSETSNPIDNVESKEKAETADSLVEISAQKSEYLIAAQNLGNHAISAQILPKYIDQDWANKIISELEERDDLAEHGVIDSIEIENGKLTPELAKLTKDLSRYGITAGNLTPKEAEKVRDFVNTATPEIEQQKVEIIHSVIDESLGRLKNSLHQTQELKNRAEKLNYLKAKFEAYERGEIDTSHGFDLEPYMSGEKSLDIYDGYDEYDAEGGDDEYSDEYERGYSRKDYQRLARDYYGETPLERAFRSLSDEELIEEGYIDEEDILVYGPYSKGDLNEIGSLTYQSWTNATNWRYKTAVKGERPTLQSTVEDIIQMRGDDVDDDLNFNFIASEIIKDRQIDARDLITLTSALGQDKIEFLNKYKTTDPEEKEALDGSREAVSWCAYYSAKLCNISTEELREQYGSDRPIKADFFKEVGDRVKGWTDRQSERTKELASAYVYKLDMWLQTAERNLEMFDIDNSENDTKQLEAIESGE